MNALPLDQGSPTFQSSAVGKVSRTGLAAAVRSQIVRVPTSALPRPSLRSSVSLKVFLILSLVVGVSVLQPWKSLRSEPVANASAVDDVKSARRVTIATPEPAATTEVVLPATIRPWQSTTLHARVNGYLTVWNKDLGAAVKAGEVLATIETPELDQEVAEATASYHEAAAAAVQARAERQEAVADLQAAEAQLARARAEAELAVSLLARRETLLKSRAISEEEYDTYRKQVEARTADVRAAEADVTRRKSNLETRAAVITAREATAKSRSANVERLKELQQFKHIVAPFDGVITSRSAEVGMLVTAGKESLFTIEDMSRVRVRVNVPQAYAAQTMPGASATIHVPEYASKPVVGTITRIAEGVDATTRTMQAEVELDNAARRFQPGSYAQVALTTSQDPSSWTIPTNTLQMRVDGPHVAVVDDRQQVALRRVALGRDLGKRVVVVEGIHGGERLVVNPADDLATGAAVSVNDVATGPAFDEPGISQTGE